MTLKEEINNSLKGKTLNDYVINEIIPFNYPIYKIKSSFLVNNLPEKTLSEIYKVFIRCIDSGINTKPALKGFLGLAENDFLWKELYELRSKNLIEFNENTWTVNPAGHDFIQGKGIIENLEEDECEFLVDGLTGGVLPNETLKHNPRWKNLDFGFKISNSNSEFIENNFAELSDVHKIANENESYLVKHLPESKVTITQLHKGFVLIEYKPRNSDKPDLECYVEVREAEAPFSKIAGLTKTLASEYPDIIYKLTDSEREIAALAQIDIVQEKVVDVGIDAESESLDLWRGTQLFEDSIHSVKRNLFIEMPRVWNAARQYLSLIESALKRNVTVTFLYGLPNYQNDEEILKSLFKLKEIYGNKFYLVDLPNHLSSLKHSKYNGTHRRVLIKDNEYYITSTFNFFASGKKGNQKVANEDISVNRKKVREEWLRVFEMYQLDKTFCQ